MSTSKGLAAEQKARAYLEKNDYQFIASNVKYRFAEIDLIMKKASIYVFIEVKYRQSKRYGGAIAAIHTQQQQRLKSAAQYYMQQHQIKSMARFDVIAIDQEHIQWIQDAF